MVSIDSIFGTRVLNHREFGEKALPLDATEQIQQFHDSMDQLGRIFNSSCTHWVLANGGAVHYYARFIGETRLPTDVDIITPSAELKSVQELLTANSVVAEYHPNPIEKHRLVYFDPQVKARVGELDVDILKSSRIIHPPSQIILQPDFNSEAFQRNIRTSVGGLQTPPLAPLEFVALAKLFQARETPKQDLSDLYLIRRIFQKDPGLFNINLYNYYIDNWIRPV